MKDIQNLLDGYRTFYKTKYLQHSGQYETLAKGQSPRLMVISCCDSRVNPTDIFQVQPGDIFTVRNVANLIPPYEEKGEYHGTSAALEFAVTGLDVDYIIVMGHSQCGGIKACLGACQDDNPAPSFINNWMSLARNTAKGVMADNPQADDAELQTLTEQAAVLSSLENLKTFPFIKRNIEAGVLKIYGAHFDIGSGVLNIKPPGQKEFQPVEVNPGTDKKPAKTG